MFCTRAQRTQSVGLWELGSGRSAVFSLLKLSSALCGCLALPCRGCLSWCAPAHCSLAHRLLQLLTRHHASGVDFLLGLPAAVSHKSTAAWLVIISSKLVSLNNKIIVLNNHRHIICNKLIINSIQLCCLNNKLGMLVRAILVLACQVHATLVRQAFFII